MRPFGCSFIWAGWDKIHGYQLYQSDPSGNYGGWKATCVGSNSTTAQSIFKTDYEESSNVEDAKKLLVKVLGKTSESASIVPEKLELIVIQKNEESGLMEIKSFSTSDISTMVKSVESK
jgi:20S proteasome subunit alpha 3